MNNNSMQTYKNEPYYYMLATQTEKERINKTNKKNKIFKSISISFFSILLILIHIL